MRKSSFVVVVFALFSLGACAQQSQDIKRHSPSEAEGKMPVENPDKHVRGELLVRFHEDLNETERRKFYVLNADRNLSVKEVEKIGKGPLYRVVVPEAIDLEKAIQILKASGKFKYIEKNVIYNTMPIKGGA